MSREIPFGMLRACFALARLLMTTMCHAEPKAKHLVPGCARLFAPQSCAQTCTELVEVPVLRPKEVSKE